MAKKRKLLDTLESLLSKKIIIAIILCLISLLIAMKNPQSIFRHGQAYTDQSVYQYVATVIEDGGMPYRDTFDHKGPLIYIIYFLGNLINDLHGVWFFELASVIITVFFLYKIARLFKCNRLSAILATVVTTTPWILNFYNPATVEEFALPFCTVSLYIFLDLLINNRISVFRSVLCGFCLGGVLMLKPTMASVWLVFSIAAFIHYIKQKQPQNLIKTILFFLFGILIFVTPIIIWLIKNNAFNDFISQYIIFNSEYTKSRSNISSMLSTIPFFLVPLVAYSLVATTCYFIKRKSLLNGALLSFMVISLILTIIPGRAYIHYGMALVPTMIYSFSKLFELWPSIYKKIPILARVIIIMAFIGFITISWGKSTISILKSVNLAHHTHYSPENSAIIEYLKNNSNSTDIIAVYGSNNAIYNGSGLHAASKYSYTLPIDQVNKEIRESYLADWAKEKPKFIITDRKPDEEIENFLIRHHYSKTLTVSEEKSIYSLEL